MNKIDELIKSFEAWEAAEHDDLKLCLLEKGVARAIFKISSKIHTPHSMPMIIGLHLEKMASMVGVYSVMTLTRSEEYALYSKTIRTKLYEPTVPEEKYLEISALVLNDRKAQTDLISVEAKVSNLQGTLKAYYIFHYAVRPASVIEAKLQKIQERALAGTVQ